jgi:hypothetical protein
MLIVGVFTSNRRTVIMEGLVRDMAIYGGS